MSVQLERSEADLRTVKIYREDENRKYSHEIEILNGEITSLRMNEEMLLKNVDELKDNLSNVSNERNDVREQHDSLQNEIESMQKLLYDETEAGSKAASKVVLLVRQLDEEQRRATEALHQVDDLRMQLNSSLMTSDTFKTELIQARALLHDHIAKVRDHVCQLEERKTILLCAQETELKQSLNRTTSSLEDRSKSLDDRQRELETINHLLSRLQIDYERSKSDLSIAHDKLVQHEIANETLKQYLTEKTNEVIEEARESDFSLLRLI